MDYSSFKRNKFERFCCVKPLTKYKCKYCDITADLWITLNDHVLDCHTSVQNNFKTDSVIREYPYHSCDFTSFSVIVWYLHKRKCTYALDATKKENKCSDSLNKRIETDILNQTTSELSNTCCTTKINVEAQITPRQTCDNKIISRYINSELFFFCNACIYISKFRWEITQHYLKNHTDSKDGLKYECSQCFYTFTKKLELKRHIIHVHDGLHCDQCKYKCSKRYDLKLHINLQHARENIVYNECSQCSYKTPFKRDLKTHIIIRHTHSEAIEWFQCEQCSYKAKTKNYLQRHIKGKHKQIKRIRKKVLQCSQCSYNTAHRHCLNYHITARHTNLKFECHQCGEKVKTKNSLVTHNKLKHPSKNQVLHQCGDCSFKTNNKSTLESHVIARHTDPEKINWFECDKCDYRAKEKSRLKAHIKARHNH